MAGYNVIETFDSRQISAGTDAKRIVFMWIVQTFGDASETDIYQFAFNPQNLTTIVPLAPYTVDGLNRNEIDAKNIAGPGGIWKISATYGSNPVIAALDIQNTMPVYGGLDAPLTVGYSASVTGQTIHITQALASIYAINGDGTDVIASGSNAVMAGNATITLDGSPSGLTSGQTIIFQPAQGWTAGFYTISSVSGSTIGVSGSGPAPSGTSGGIWVVYGPSVTANGGGTAPDTGGAIGVSLNGVAGCDIQKPLLEWNLRGVISPFSSRMMAQYYSQAFTINDAPFWNYSENEVQFTGAEVEIIDQIAARITLKFISSPSQYNVKVTSKIYIPFVAGWDRVDIRYMPGVVGTGAGAVSTQIPIAAYTWQVFQESNFDNLGVTVPPTS